MKVQAHQRTIVALGLSVAMLLLLASIVACKKDESSPTSPPTSPAIAGQWRGSAQENQAPAYVFDISASIAQNGGALNGTWIWTERTSASATQCWFTGTINTNRFVTIQETSFVALNWYGSGWFNSSYTGNLNTRGDSLALSWTDYGSGTILLIKQ